MQPKAEANAQIIAIHKIYIIIKKRCIDKDMKQKEISK